ncbi:hypothetical protein AGABI2DRAFT_121479 [Agaricus bisporus var. bisporus H97]|uniref:hypothetical protein n=1 Tax=Agaricus bisporus var. bisporus (strain H97 / ATCC MYA-4626 / FGSC 10389) TaxID=936046 RepID=UPI00029F7258|nr:hypothetical protein AGABI2DRAFT_121479 [Agaricus bisporus var. bisporus H97]EKV43353.1 hypothetical protein AGABI2DRAFT_121479 [Agaricus bisporus var. bisporus H97]
MTNLNHDQAFLSEQLLLLHELDLNYSDHTVSNDNVDREMKLLDTVALLLSTGSPGDHFAAAFDKHQGLEVVLAKNGTPTSDDIAAAKELFSHLCNPEIRRAKDLYPFVARRCRASVVKRFQKLRASIIDTGFYDDFCSRLDQCSSARDPLSPSAIKLEFSHDADSLIEDYTGESLSVVLRNHLKATARATAVSEVPDLERFMGVYVVASTLAHSRFLEKWVELEDAGYQKVQRFQRCTEKLCRYIDDVHSLVKGAKRLGGPIKHRWVTDESLGIQIGEQDIRIHAETPLEAFHRASTLSSQQLEELRKRKPSITAPWQRTVHTCIHAELRIILHVGRVSMAGVADRSQPIGLSKRSCLCCVLWIEAHNVRGDIRWRTRARYKPDETWALTARACSNVSDLDLGLFDEKVVYGVSRWLQLRYASVLEFRRELYGIVRGYKLDIKLKLGDFLVH